MGRSRGGKATAGTVAAAAIVAIVAGCAAHNGGVASSGGDASIAAVRTQVESLLKITKTIETQNDTWTVRLLTLGLIGMAFTYPIGKLAWMISHGAVERARQVWPLKRKPSRRKG